MKKISLSSESGSFFIIVIYFFGIICLGFLIYSTIDSDNQGIIASVLFLIFWYLVFFRKVKKVKPLTFDENYIYTKKGDKISFQDVISIQNGKITFLKNNIQKVVFVNPYFPGKNHKLLVKYYNSKNENK